MTDQYEIGKIIGTLNSLETKIDFNTKSITTLEASFNSHKTMDREEVDKFKKDVEGVHSRLDNIQEQLSLYATFIKVIKVVFFFVVFAVTLRIGDIKSLLSGFFK